MLQKNVSSHRNAHITKYLNEKHFYEHVTD